MMDREQFTSAVLAAEPDVYKRQRYMNLPTILILALIGIALFAALRSMKKHPSGCSGHCSGCPVQCKSEKHR